MADYKYIGKPIKRPDAEDKVTGATKFAADLNFVGQLYGAVLRSPHPHANIVNIDISAAKSLPGVKVVLTGEDEHTGVGHYCYEMPTLAYKRVLYEGDPVVAVAADKLETAYEALKLVKVEYEVLKPILSVEESIAGDAEIFNDWTKLPCHKEMHYVENTNICHHTCIKKGDVEEGFAKSDYIVESYYETSGIQHVCLEGHVAIAQWDNQGLTVWGCMQSPNFMRGQLSKAFSLPYNKIRCVITPIGGGFGNKWELRAEPIAAALAKRTNGRPVKLVFTRKDEFLGAYVRGGQKIWSKSGVNKDGTLVARKIKILGDVGAYVTSGPRLNYLSSYAAAGPYNIENVLLDNYSLLTNKHVSSAYRGFGVQEVSWANECHMDDIAKAIGMDPYALRMKNAWQDGDVSPSGEQLFSVSTRPCLEAVAKNIGWGKDFERVTKDGKLRGRGLSCTCKITGTPSGSAVICKMNEDGTVTILKSGTDMGQGNDLITMQFFAEELGIDIGKLNVAPVDTLYTPYEKSATGSRLTFHMGRVLIEAAKDIKRQLANLMSKKWGCAAEDIAIVNGVIHGTDKNGKDVELAINDLGKSKVMNEQDPIIGYAMHNTVDIWDPPDKETGNSKRVSVLWFWASGAAQVLVDPKTGKIEVEKYAAAHDVGQVINSDALLGQYEGGVLQGMGHTFFEELKYDEKGYLLNGNMTDFKVPTVKDAGFELLPAFIENPHPEGPYGAKGIGECTLTPVPEAIGNAVFDATGVRLHKIPMTADDMYLALKYAKK